MNVSYRIHGRKFLISFVVIYERQIYIHEYVRKYVQVQHCAGLLCMVMKRGLNAEKHFRSVRNETSGQAVLPSALLGENKYSFGNLKIDRMVVIFWFLCYTCWSNRGVPQPPIYICVAVGCFGLYIHTVVPSASITL